MFSKQHGSGNYCTRGICPELSKAYEESVRRIDNIVGEIQVICNGVNNKRKENKRCSKVTKRT